MHWKLHQRESFKKKIAKVTGDLIGNEIGNKITNVSKNLETVTNKNDKEIPKERYISWKKAKNLLMVKD